MKVEIIKKNKKYLKTHNLKNYKAEYKKFDWKDAEKEVAWFGKGKVNAAYNAVTRHAFGKNKDKTALLWEGEKGETTAYTFLQLEEESNKFANALKKLGVQKGDRVFIFLPRIPPLYACFIGILKLGAIASTMFSAFGPDALKDRLLDSGARIVITTTELKERIDKVRKELPELKNVIVIGSQQMGEGEIKYEEVMSQASKDFKTVETGEDDPAFMLYTSGTTGKPKGVVHVHKAVLQQHMTVKWVLDLKEDDIYWCTADPGWVTGISYTILCPWSNGITSFVYGGKFDTEKWYSLIEKYKVTVWYTAPTAIRMLMAADSNSSKKYNLGSIRHACSVGEPLNPEAIRWGKKELNIVFHDNWWQTETGAIMIANYASMDVKVGSMGRPVPGVKAGIVDDSGKKVKDGQEGNLAVKPGWPSMMRTIWNNPEKYDSYFKEGWYFSGDRAWKDKDGYFWFIGRADDVIKTSGERVGPFEVESTLVSHPAVAEAGVIGKPDPVRGEIIKAFVTLKAGFQPSEQLKQEIQQFVKGKLAGHAYPREIEFREHLPKTRSGKIMRRLLKAQELGLPIGDTSTLEEY